MIRAEIQKLLKLTLQMAIAVANEDDELSDEIEKKMLKWDRFNKGTELERCVLKEIAITVVEQLGLLNND